MFYCITIMVNAVDFFNAKYFSQFFFHKLAHKRGGGIDGLTPQTFWKRYESEFEDIADKCLKGHYRFSYYNEKLVLKGRNKLPRVLAIPTMRDRLVLGVLNEYLQAEMPDMVNHEVPNQYIADMNAFLASQEHKVYCFKTDIEHFYDSLDHNVLSMKLILKLDYPMWQLVMNAINTPIFASKPTASLIIKPPSVGVPQGLAISNILASLYMSDFDRYFKEKESDGFFYRRYVDDIIILHTNDEVDFKESFEKKMIEENLKLSLSVDKTESHVIGESDVDYIGYIVKNKNLITVRSKNIQSFLKRVIRLITLLKTQYKNKALRPPFISDDATFISYYKDLLNEQIAGFKMDGHLYGWLPYFQSMNDIRLLYALDHVIHGKLLTHPGVPKDFAKDILSLPKVYWDIKKKSGSLLLDLDKITTDAGRRSFLVKRGKIDATLSYTEKEIRIIYNAYKESLKKSALASIGRKY